MTKIRTSLVDASAPLKYAIREYRRRKARGDFHVTPRTWFVTTLALVGMLAAFVGGLQGRFITFTLGVAVTYGAMVFYFYNSKRNKDHPDNFPPDEVDPWPPWRDRQGV